MPSKIPDGETRGWIVPIGGAENKENDRHILERFVGVSGGSDANIVVIPTASRMHETGPRYEKIFKELGAADDDGDDGFTAANPLWTSCTLLFMAVVVVQGDFWPWRQLKALDVDGRGGGGALS